MAGWASRAAGSCATHSARCNKVHTRAVTVARRTLAGASGPKARRGVDKQALEILERARTVKCPIHAGTLLNTRTLCPGDVVIAAAICHCVAYRTPISEVSRRTCHAVVRRRRRVPAGPTRDAARGARVTEYRALSRSRPVQPRISTTTRSKVVRVELFTEVS